MEILKEAFGIDKDKLCRMCWTYSRFKNNLYCVNCGELKAEVKHGGQ